MKKRAFSILEVMIAFSIIAICGGALLINFQKSHQDRQEKDSVDIVESKLRMAAQLAKITGGEVRVMVEEEDGVQKIFLSSDVGASERMKANVNRKTTLPHVREIEFMSESDNETTLSFYPWGIEDRESEVHILFHSGNSATCLPAKYAPNVVSEDTKEIDELFPHEILEDEKEEKHVYTD